PQAPKPQPHAQTANDGGASEAADSTAPPDPPEHDAGELLALEPRERWRAVVEHLRETAAPVAATLEHANLLQFDDEEVVLSFLPGYYDLFDESERAAVAEAAIMELFGPEWTLRATLREPDDESNGDPTLAEEREAEIEARREQLEEEVTHHPVVERARELFDPEKERTRVELFEE
ncbi:MAG: hypothetical protein ACOCV2_07085, partial [Persicimonas sp.]